ncbi:hypothetical protein [Undibacterium crateris]|nr:hypothetical protein [Undibacterium crateris]NDI84190.1 hypothetical protein [Undibacterium crateris]
MISLDDNSDSMRRIMMRPTRSEKVMSHLMFGLLALTADQLMRLFT